MRLTLWYSAVLAAFIVVFAVFVYLLARAGWNRALEAQLASDAAGLAYTLRHDPDEVGELDEHGVVTAFWVAPGDNTGYASAAWTGAGLTDALASAHGGDSWRWVARDGRPFRMHRGESATRGGPRRFVVARDASLMERSLAALGLTLMFTVPATLVLASVAGLFLAGRVLAPVRAITAKAGSISADQLSERLPVANPSDEFGRLAGVFNDLLSRLEASFAQLKRFTADASHELRTPLTAIRSVGEVGLQRERNVEGLRSVIGSILEESDRLTRLVEALLTITRAESPTARLALAPLDLAELAREVADDIGVLAEERNQRLTVEDHGAVPTTGDRLLLRHAVINLLDNAIKYTPPGGTITVTAGRTPGGESYVEVRDTGPGIAPEHHTAVFDRFYRARPAQAEGQPGAGLGLAIVRLAAESHGGRVELGSALGRGSTFRIVLPSRGPAGDVAPDSSTAAAAAPQGAPEDR
ncbi:MAG: HAMP domain-containing protein [Gemmatimonadetes bacterium]|nr:HAMP domain-containing protein [Gemmatimonadota bacterium]